MQRVLFLCTGNYYRSRYAEAFFNWQAQHRGLPWKAESRGLAIQADNTGPISSHTKASLVAQGIWSEGYDRYPLPLAESDLQAAHHIVAVKEAEHRPMLEAQFPAWRECVEYWHVHDMDCALPSDAIPHLEREIISLIERLAA